MFDKLNRYKIKGDFTFSLNQSFKQCCNAPDDKVGIYLIYKVENKIETLLYIGSSGQKDKNGNLKVRKGGLKDRLINGYHPNRFGQEKRIKRFLAFPMQMQKEGIDTIRIYWWVTWDDLIQDFPVDIERLLQKEYAFLPSWHS